MLENQLEALIDTHGLATVLGAIAGVCWEKGDHLRSNWQDPRAARVWDRMGRKVSTAADAAASEEI